jgi:outer membrane protein OmpA-like peptidoglycan-associated protein
MIVVLGFALVACRHPGHDVVVLLPDPDGKVGQAEVATPGGSRLLTEAHQMTKVTDATIPPSATMTVDSAYIQSHFGEALAAQPVPPLKFRLYFLSGSTRLDAASLALVPEIIAAIKARDSRDVGIHGHSDTVGQTEDNIALSLRRAMAIKELILEAGLAVTNFEITSHGEGNPLVPTPDGVAEPLNRRVEVVVR